MVRYVVPFEPMNIMVLADIQWAGWNGPTATGTLKKAIQRGVDNKCKFLGGGDYIDFMSPSNREEYQRARIYDTARNVMSEKADELIRELYHEFLTLTHGQWLGLVEGHHFFEFPEGDTSDKRLCKMLGGARFLGTSGYIGLAFQRADSRAGITVNIWLHHGAGSCQTAAGQISKLERLAGSFEADVFVMAHYTQKPQGECERVYPVWKGIPHLKHKVIKLVGAGGFGRGYQVGCKHGKIPRGNYVERAAMRPTVLGAPIIRITPERVFKTVNGRIRESYEVDIKVES